MKKKIKLVSPILTAALFALSALLFAAPSALGESVIYEAHTPATQSYISYCDGNYHGIPYCNFTKTFSVPEEQTATSLTWFDLGCHSSDKPEVILSYSLVNADTFETVAETLESVTVDCTPEYPEEGGVPFTIAIPPTTLEAGQEYFLMLHSSTNGRERAYWGVNADIQSSFRVGSSVNLVGVAPEGISQAGTDGESVPESGMVNENTVVFHATPTSDAGAQVRLQVEVRRFGEDFTGEPVASGEFVQSGEPAAVSVAGLPDGAYRWRLRATDGQGSFSEWREFGEPDNSDFEIFAGSFPETLAIPNPSCEAPVSFVPHAPLVLESANFWTSCHGQHPCNSPAWSRVMDADGSILLAESDVLAGGFEYTQGAHDVNYTTMFSGDNRILLEPGRIYTFRNFQENGNHCTDGPYNPDSAYLNVSSPFAPGGREPVVIVPGILGSVLERIPDGGEVWPDMDSILSSAGDEHLEELALGASGAQIPGREMRPGRLIRSESVSVLGADVERVVYGNLVKEFTERGYVVGADLFEAPYDWRLDLRDESARLAAVIGAARAASPGGKISIVAHSMGGLLVKQYLAGLDDMSFVNKVVLAGVPQLGAPDMFKALNYGDDLGFTIPVINKSVLNPERIKSISQNMPGVYELLPSRRYVDVNGGYVKDFRSGGAQVLSFDDTAALMTADPADARNATLLTGAQEFHDALDNAPITGPDVYNIAACDNPSTMGEFRLYDGGHVDIGGANGDGTVPLVSVTNLASGYENYFISWRRTRIDHTGLVQHAAATELIGDLVEGAPVTLPEGMDMSSSVCFPESFEPAPLTLRFSTHSPVALHVYDPAGNHTGPTVEGDVELGIPGSSYRTVGGNSFAFVPAGDGYRVVADAYDPGRFTLKTALLGSGDEIVSAANYIDIPLPGPDVIAEAVFSGEGPAPELALDNDGDGAFDETVVPTAELGAETAGDTIPPEISVSGVPEAEVEPGGYATIQFTVSDDLSGVAYAKASMDGVPFQSGQVLAVAPGPHKIVIEAADNSGNPSAFTAEFSGAAYPDGPSSAGDSGDESGGSDADYDSPGTSSRSGSYSNGAGRSYEKSVATSTAGQVLEAMTECLAAPAVNLGRWRANDGEEVVRLQALLNREFGLSIPLTGFFGPITELAVKIFQLTHFDEILAPWKLTSATGFVGKHTLLKLSVLACPGADGQALGTGLSFRP